MKKLLLVLSFTPNTEFWLADEFRKMGYETIVLSNPYAFKFVERKSRLNRLKSQFMYWTLGWKAHKRAKAEDVERVVFWNWNSAFSFVLRNCLFPFKRSRLVPVVALHLILINPKGLKRKLWEALFSITRYYPLLYWGVNSIYEQESYAQQYNLESKYFAVIPDSYETRDIPSKETLEKMTVKSKNVFTGGANRDWETLFRVAELLPDYQFNCIALKRNFKISESDIPKNVTIWFDTTSEFFYSKLYEAEIVCLPLNRMEACGLIVLTKSALMEKPLITTDTPNMRNYIDNGKNGFLTPMGDAQKIAEDIRLLENPELRRAIASNMKARIEEHSPRAYAKRIMKI